MGAPKQKWTSAEEAALKAGIAKYGAGKWSTILKDPAYSTILRSRSNVDLKDKWRNLNVMASGCGSRQRARLLTKSSQLVPKHDPSPMALGMVLEADIDAVDAKPLSISSGPLRNFVSKKPFSRSENLIVEAIQILKEPRGSNKTAIAMYIEEHYLTPPNLERLLVASLKLLTDNGKLIKVKHLYRIAPSSQSYNVRKEPSPLLLEGRPKDSPRPRVDSNGTKVVTKAQIEAELEKMRSMSAEEAAAAAAQAVAEAEAAIAEAEAAAREAEDAERDAEVAQAFAEASMKALKCKTLCICEWWVVCLRGWTKKELKTWQRVVSCQICCGKNCSAILALYKMSGIV